MKTTIDRNKVHDDLRAKYGDTCTRAELLAYAQKTGVDPRWIYFTPAARREFQVSHGVYRVPANGDPVCVPPRRGRPPVAENAGGIKLPKVTKSLKTVDVPKPVAPIAPMPVVDAQPVAPIAPMPVVDAQPVVSALALTVSSDASKQSLQSKIQSLSHEASELISVPVKNRAFVPFGDFDVVRTIVASREFHPVFITGLSGNGKTFQIRQACAIEKREFVRVNITAETDEDDLIGGFRLKNGETVFELGPVVIAMLRGAVLLIDEIDLASPKIMCLQSIMEGNDLVIKKLGITITPAAGFTVFATANTKGRGSADGKFVGANLLNEAFLERFPVTIEQPYPSAKIEQKILAKTYEQLGGVLTSETTDFFERLSKWADGIRATFYEEGVDDLIATRRLVHIVKTFHIFGDMNRSMNLCLNRFDPQVKAQFLDLWAKLTPDAQTAAPESQQPVEF